MEDAPIKGIILVFLFVIGIAIALTTTGINFFSSVNSQGAIQDSPVFFIFLLLTAVICTVLVRWIVSENDTTAPFSTGGFFNAVLASILIGGIAHELTHVLLLQHAVQLNIHFGNTNSIFSTCCLSPGELPQEEIAYTVQFFAMAAWVYFSRKSFFPSTMSQKAESKKALLRMELKEKKKGRVDYSDPSWDAHKKEVEAYLGFGREKDNKFEDDSLQPETSPSQLDKLKVRRE